MLFGIPHAVHKDLKLINFVILLAKWYINKQRSDEKPLFFIELLNIIKTKVKILIVANNMSDRLNTPWQDALDRVL